MKFRSVLGLAAIALTLSGCANINTQSRNFVGNQAIAKTVDASQRALYSVNKTFVSNGVVVRSWTAFCAEPSPDALIAYATSVAASANVPGRALDLALSQQQSAASIGLRTQTIQLLRDGMYRLCESYASGAIDDDDMAMLQRRYQNMMLGLLAIEQITGPVIARQVSLSSTASSAIGKSVAEISKVLGDAAADLANAKAESIDADADVKSKQAALDKANQDRKEKPGKDSDAAQTTASDDLEKSLKAHKKAVIGKNAKQTAYDSIEASLKDAQRMATSANSSVIFADLNPSGPPKPGNVSDFQVAVKGVTEIVASILDHTQQSDICAAIFSSSPVSKTKAGAMQRAIDYCAFFAVPEPQGADEKQASARSVLRQSMKENMKTSIEKRTRAE